MFNSFLRQVALSFSFAILLYSCNNGRNQEKVKGYSTLKIMLDTTSAFFPDSPTIHANNIVSNYTGYDSIYKSTVYLYDSVENGPVTIILNSFLDTVFRKQILLVKDTMIFFSEEELPYFKKGDPLSMNLTDLQPGEKICISHGFSACIGGINQSKEQKIIIEQKNEGYTIDFLTYAKWVPDPAPLRVKKMVDRSLKDSLLDFQTSAINFLKLPNRGFCMGSESYLIRKGNTVYSFYDGSCWGKIRYDKILRMINPDSYK